MSSARPRVPRERSRRLAGHVSPRLFTGGRRRRRRAPAVLLGSALVTVVLIIVVSLLGSSGNGDHAPYERHSAVGSLSPVHAPARSARVPGGQPQDATRFAVDLSNPDLVQLRFSQKPRAGLLFDVRSGRVLWRLNPTRRLPIASLTKMMTVLVVVERENPHARVKITKQAVTTPGSGVGVLPRGKRVQLEALLNGLLLVSGNDAAVALARYTAGGVRRFVRLMNERARQLGLSRTRFSTPHGLSDRGNYSCALDLAALARADLARRRIRRIARRDRAIVKFPIKGGRLFLYNNNPLIRAGYRGVTGLKTGYTDRSGRSIVATARRGRLELGVVLLHSYNPAAQAPKLLNRGFATLRQTP